MIIEVDYSIIIPDITQVLWNGKGKFTPAEPLPSDRVALLRSCIQRISADSPMGTLVLS